MNRRSLAALVLLAAAPTAIAITDGWDMSAETAERTWNSARLAWAQDIHPDEPTTSYLQANVGPPPREMWCLSQDPWPVDCDAWEAHVDVWLHHYLDVPYADELPAGMDPFPKECSSACDNNF